MQAQLHTVRGEVAMRQASEFVRRPVPGQAVQAAMATRRGSQFVRRGGGASSSTSFGSGWLIQA